MNTKVVKNHDLISYSVVDTLDIIKRRAKERKIKINEDSKLSSVTKKVLDFRGAQYTYGKDVNPHFTHDSYYWLPEWIMEDIIIEEILASIQGVKPSTDVYRSRLSILEKEWSTLQLQDIPDTVEDTLLLDMMKYNGTVVQYKSIVLKYVPEYLSNQIPYKDDLYLEILSGTPCVHYSRDEVLSKGIEGILGYSDTDIENEHTCQCSNKNEEIYNILDILTDLVNELKNRVDNLESKSIREFLTQGQEDDILVQALNTQQRIKRKDFEKTFEGIIGNMYVPITFSTYEAYLKKYGDTIPYIRFKVALNDQSNTTDTLNCEVCESAQDNKSVYVYITNPHRILEHIIGGMYDFIKSGNTWMLIGRASEKYWKAQTLEELLLQYILDPCVDKERILRDINNA